MIDKKLSDTDKWEAWMTTEPTPEPGKIEDLWCWLRDSLHTWTLCCIGWHSKPSRGIKKFDGGRQSLLCRYCRKIIGSWRHS